MSLRSTLVVLGLCCAWSVSYAETTFNPARPFKLTQTCDAYTSLKKRSNPTTLSTDHTYPALGENKADGATHTLLDIQGKRQWVALTCGQYLGTSPTTVPTVPVRSQPDTCLPFFDNQNNPVKLNTGMADITPPAPTLNAFDNAINQTCGASGNSVSGSEFQALMRAHPDVLQRLFTFTQGKVFADRPVATTPNDYLSQLTEAWFAIKAFDHIFCGEPKTGSAIGGLHFVGRYVQLQQTGEACRMDNFRQNEVVSGVLYSMGVSMKTPNGIARSSIKGYGLSLNAEDILKAATAAFANNPTSSNESSACLLNMTDAGKRFTSVFVRRASGIRTFYPDGTPDPREPTCQGNVNL